MTKPISEPTPALESANYGWRIRQLERRPTPPGNPWVQCSFGGIYGFAGHTYPLWNWEFATLSNLFTNAPDMFSLSVANDVINIPAGIFVANVKITYHVNGQFLDLAPQSGLTRTHPGCLLSEIWLSVDGGADLKDYFSESKEDYDVSQFLSGGLGQFSHEVAGFVTTDEPTSAYPFINSWGALKGPNNTGTFPEFPPGYSGSVYMERIDTYPEPGA